MRLQVAITALACGLIAGILDGCSTVTPAPINQPPIMTEYKGWIIRVIPSVVDSWPNLWRARVRVWPSEVRPETHPGIDVSFSGTATERSAVEQAATTAAHRYIDASLPVHRQ